MADQSWVATAVVAAAAVLALAVLGWRGHLSRRSLEESPWRQTPLGPRDLLIAMGILVLGMVGATLVIQTVAGKAESLGPLVRVLLGQAAVQLPVVIYVLARTRTAAGGWREVGLVPRQAGRELRMGVLGLAAAVPLVWGVTAVVVAMGQLLGQEAPKLGHELLELLQQSRGAERAGLLASAVVVAPVLEEVIFRGLVQSAMLSVLGPRRRWAIVLAAGVIFAGIHVGVPWQALPGLAVLGVMLGYLYERSGSLWPCFVMHAGFNAINAGMAIAMG